MTSRLTRAILMVAVTALPAAAQDPAVAKLTTSIDCLSNFDYSIRTSAARALRRMPAEDVVPALTEAARGHADQFVRYRALVLLTAFRHPATGDLMRSLLSDRNDRVREVAYRWFEEHPDVRLVPTLLAALNTELAEFVRPALIRALAAHDDETAVQRALVAEAGRGLDFFRSAVIEALGEHRATYALDAITAAAALEGPLQDDAVIALGRIGDKRALPALTSLASLNADVVPAQQAALCLLESDCPMRIEALTATARSRNAPPAAARAAVAALGALAERSNDSATDALFALASEATGRLRDDVAVALASAAVRAPAHILTWVDRASENVRIAAVEILRSGFEALEEDYAEEQFFATARAAYWAAGEGSTTRTVAATLIDTLEF